MAKLTLNDVSNLTGAESTAISTINNNSAAIEAALENTLSRDGTTPNQMSADIDMNSNDIINVDNIHANTLVLDGSTVGTLLFDTTEFETKYLGPKTSDPTLDNAGSALIEGALYWNTVSDEMRVYNGASWSIFGRDEADEIIYDNATSGLTATNVQTALDELAGSGGSIVDGSITTAKIQDGAVTVAKLDNRTGSLTIGAPALLTHISQPQTMEAWSGNWNIGNNSTDCKATHDAMLAAGVREIKLKSGGVYRMASALATIGSSVHYRGDSMSNSSLVFTQTSGQCLYLYSTTTNASCVFEDMTIGLDNGGTNITAFIYALAHTQDYAPDFLTIRNVNLTGYDAGSTVSYGILLDGAPRQGAGSGLVGIRNVHIDRVEIFQTSFRSIEVRQGNSVRINNAACYLTGTSANNAVQITGPSTTYKSSGVHISNANMSGDFFADNVDNLNLNGKFGNIDLGTSSSSYCQDAIGSLSSGNVVIRGDNIALTGKFGTVSTTADASKVRVTGIGTVGTNSGANCILTLN